MSGRVPDTLWLATSGEAPSFPSLKGDVAARVAIVGGGFTGLSAALHIARSGADVVLLEARRIGWGASGRNAGFVVPNFSKADPAGVIAKLGHSKGEALLALVGSGGDRVFEHAQYAGLGRQAERNGWLQPAHSPAAAAMLRKRVEIWKQLGRPVEWLDEAETARRTGMDIYHGALADRSGGMINPLAYAWGLARLAEAAGARIMERTVVAAIEAAGGGWRLDTADGTVRADMVLLCTNAETAGAAARLARSVIPLGVYQMATDPLPADLVRAFSPNREPVSDTRSNIFTYRLDAENRLISGGMALVPFGAERRMGARIASRLAAELGLGDVPRVAHVWRGTAAVTTDFLPHIFTYGPGFVGVTACNGRGVAMTTMMGEVLASMVGGVPLAALPVPAGPPPVIPFRPLAAFAPSAVLAKGMWSDHRTTRRSINRHTRISPTSKGEL